MARGLSRVVGEPIPPQQQTKEEWEREEKELLQTKKSVKDLLSRVSSIISATGLTREMFHEWAFAGRPQPGLEDWFFSPA
jgi:hypothetical protein